MKSIHKIKLEVTGNPQKFTTHINFKILHFDVQHGEPCMWIQVDTRLRKEERTIQLFGTGADIGFDEQKHVGTVLMGAYVWHFYLKGINNG